MAAAKRLRSEYVVAVVGVVQRRSDDTVNPKIATGEVEVLAREIRVLNEAKTPPFQITEESPVSEDVRLRYRYLDLRRPRLQHNIGLRHRVTMAVRKYFDANGFWEIETPILARSTPEGARDFLVPSRLHPGEFYALPQSPQIFKQILMISGMDRYFQIVRCFRDEDQRADRQLEFTQIDVEMSFARPDSVYGIIEPLVREIFKTIGHDAVLPIRRMPYAEAIASYGSDKPDLRCGMEICDLSEVFRDSEFRVFKQIVAEGGVVRGFAVPGREPLLPEPARWPGRPGEDAGVHRADLGQTGGAAAQLGESAQRGGPASGARSHRRDRRRPAADGGGQAGRHVEAARAAAPGDRQEGKPPESRRVRVSLGHRLSAAGIPRGRRPLVLHAPPVHVAAGRGYRPARDRSRQRSRQGLRPGPERQRDRRRQHPDSRSRCCSRGSSSASASATRRRSCSSGSFSRRWPTARRRTAASRSASIGSSRFWPANRPSAR